MHQVNCQDRDDCAQLSTRPRSSEWICGLQLPTEPHMQFWAFKWTEKLNLWAHKGFGALRSSPVGSPKLSFKISRSREMRPLHKTSGLNPMSFWRSLGPHRLPLLPWANRSYVPGSKLYQLRHVWQFDSIYPETVHPSEHDRLLRLRTITTIASAHLCSNRVDS